MPEEGEIFEFLTISMARITGTVLLAVYNYNLSRELVSKSSLGILLIILALILAHIGIQKKFSPEPLVVTLVMTVSSLWSNSGIILLLADNGILSASGQFRETQFPGLVAICCAFLIIGCVGTLQNKGAFPLLSFGLGLANIHVLAMSNDPSLGSSGIACNFMIVTVISIYLVAVRFANMRAGKKALPAEKKVSFPNRISRNHLVVSGILANIVSSSILSGKLLGTVTVLFSGQANWMFTSAAYQVAVSVASFWARDIIHATFFSLLAMLKIVEGYSLLNQPSTSGEQLLPSSFMVVLAVLFFTLSLMMCLQNVCIGLYTLLFAIYCATLTLPSGINHNAAQSVNLVIFFTSVAHMSLRLYLSKTDFRIPERKGLAQMMNSCFRCMKITPRIVMHHPYSPTLNTRDVDVIGHAFNTLATFSLTVQAQGTFILVMASGSMVHMAGLMSLYTGKAAESSAFVFYGVLWVTWGLAEYMALQVPVRAFYIAVGIICFLVLNGFLTMCMTTLNTAWFTNSLFLEVLLIMSLLNTLNIVPSQCVVVFSILFGVVSFYCFLAALVNGTLVAPHLPWGKPLLKPTLPQESCTLCPFPAKKVTSIRKIAELMKSGGICVIPVDLGYAVASSCYFSDSVQKVSKLEMEAEDAEISIFISGFSDLREEKSVLGRRLRGLILGLGPNPVGFVLPRKVLKHLLHPAVSSSPQLSQDAAVSSSPQLSQDPAESSSPQLSQDPAVSSSPQLSQDPAESSSPQLSQDPAESSSPQLSQDPAESSSPQLSQDPAWL
ncbi:PREDICTED: uncharacterized protein LOC108793333 [Nanorana parkeri]|uniref:uncharacterized protein LOC108793333 n=1 Tax=Nanorana parkeri TaxID=125878 RepID=UPI000854390F|nr:PREDICTED: uncharacterized protein LOC108793333 [Nanorana parkeri]